MYVVVIADNIKCIILPAARCHRGICLLCLLRLFYTRHVQFSCKIDTICVSCSESIAGLGLEVEHGEGPGLRVWQKRGCKLIIGDVPSVGGVVVLC